MNDFDLKTLYDDVRPSPWAVEKLRSKIEAMQTDSFDLIWSMFRRRISVGLVASLAIVMVLNVRMATLDDSSIETELQEVIGTNRGDFLSSTIPDYTHVLD